MMTSQGLHHHTYLVNRKLGTLHPQLKFLSQAAYVNQKCCVPTQTKNNKQIKFLIENRVNGMDILREFLESSTIHGLTYISRAGVSFCGTIVSYRNFLSDQANKDYLVYHCLSQFHWGRNPDRQVVQGLAG